MILQQTLPYRPWSDPALRRLPGVQPLGALPWLLRDEAHAAQMAERDRLLTERRGDVLGEGAGPAVDELFELVLSVLSEDPGYVVGPDVARRPDGVEVPLRADTPIATMARLVQEDLLLHEKRGEEHVLVCGSLLFPSSWTLSQKLGLPLGRIHQPVPPYAPVAHRVQRMFDMLRPETPLWRANWLTYRDPDLYQPRREYETKPSHEGGTGFLRSERQTFRKLPRSGAVVFGIHTYVLPLETFARELPPGNGRDHSGPDGRSGVEG